MTAETDHALSFVLAGQLFSVATGAVERVFAILEVLHGGVLVAAEMDARDSPWKWKHARIGADGLAIFERFPVSVLEDQIPHCTKIGSSDSELDRRIDRELFKTLRAEARKSR